MKPLMLVVALLLTSIATSPRSGIGTRIAAPISIIQLIATPEKYEGKSVSALGISNFRPGVASFICTGKTLIFASIKTD
jgi:hypothetical protein